MSAFITFRMRDYSDEKSSIQIEINDVDSLNYSDVALADPGGAANVLHSAIQGVTIGSVAKYTAKTEDEAVNDTNPGNVHAQIERALRVYGRTAAGKLHTITIPTADNTVLAQVGTDLVDLTGTEMAALVSALEAHWEPGGNTVTIEKAVLIGRAS